MSGRYERVNAQDEDDSHSPSLPQRIPNSPPPSFHSRASSILSVDRDRGDGRHSRVDSALADAFDSADDSEDEADDTQRLVHSTPQSSSAAFTPSSGSSATSSSHQGTTAAAAAVPNPHAASGATAPPGTASTPFRIYGGGIQSDGVFSNIMAKPERGEEKEEQPPTYEQAAADAAPPYWETTILAPGLGGPDEVYIDGMPVGSFFSFAWNGMISVSIQPLIGFLLTYLLHSSHAAKNGSRSGLGITLIQYGFYVKGTGSGAGAMGGAPDGYANPPDPNAHDFDPNSVGTGGGGGSSGGDSNGGSSGIEGSEWIAYILMIVGWFVLIRAISDYIRARRHEQLVLQSPDRGLGVAIVAEGESPDRVV